MDEEYNESVDTSADMDVSDVDVDDDVPTDIPDDVPEDDYSETDVVDDVSDDMIDETADDGAEYDEVDESIEEDSIEPGTEEMDESMDDIDENTLEESDDSSEGYEELDIPEDTDGFDEEQGNGIDDIEEIPEDTDNSEVTDQEEAFDEDIPEDVTDTEATDENSDVEDTDTYEQSADMANADSTDEMTDSEDDNHSDLETYGYKTSPETQDAVNPETSGEYVSADNPYREQWEEFSDGKDGSDRWDSLKDVPFAGDEQADTSEGPDMAATSESTDTPEINSVSDYMNAHNYGVDDYAEYSQDPVWRELHSATFPNNELSLLIDVNDHPSDSIEYSDMVNALEYANVEYRPIELHDGERTENEIVEHLSGGDLTEGSCSSLALAYAGNKGGYDVLDFRDGQSRSFFSSRDSIQKVANLSGVKSTTLRGTNDIDCANQLLGSMTPGKEYYLATGQHASIVRNTDTGMEYLELQHPTSSGWHKLDNNILMNRFGCRNSHSCEFTNYLMDVDSLSHSKEFLNILGYINTAGSDQRKGGMGYVR